MSGFICPVCGEPLEIEERSYVCSSRHSFDIAAKGYVNLLLSNRMNAKLPGDNKLMVNARADFLNKGYYSHLAEAVSDRAAELFKGGAVLDAGCGEGYYTEKIYEKIKTRHDDFSLLGIDISKFACAHAARRFKNDSRCEVGAASVFHIPMKSESADLLVTMFAPFCREEYFRVLKKGGTLIMAIPGEEHLMSLKAAVYDEPYKNRTEDYDIEGFELTESAKLSRTIFIDNSEDIQALFAMTPYYYKTSMKGHERVRALKALETRADFEVLVYKK